MNDTATEAVKHVSFKDRISEMNEEQLRDIATAEFGVTIDGQLKKDTIIKFLLDAFEATKSQADNMNKVSAQLFLDFDPKESIIQVKFIPLDFPTAPVECTTDCGKGIRGPKNKKGLKRVPRFKFIPGETYKLPLCVILHLESLTYRDSKPQYDPVTGMITGNIPVIKPRFMLQMILTNEQMQDMNTNL